MKVTQAINAFLAAKTGHPGYDLIERFLAVGGAAAMETQVNVAPGNGEPVEGKRTTWTDGINTWWNIRIPKSANKEPTWSDYDLRFPLEVYADGVGSTGWDWAARVSRWVGFDFDSITGHAQGVGISPDQLKRICEAVQSLPYVEVRRSTGGHGIHFYVMLDAIPTENHTEHAALARCVLGMMSAECNFDFASQIDSCGHIMWIWHQKMTGTQGLELIKPSDKVLTQADLPINWRDHLEVVKRQRSKVRINGIEEKTEEDIFDMLTSSRRIVPLEESHKNVIQALQDSGYTTIWVTDHHLLQTHTCAIQSLVNDPDTRSNLGIVGTFSTNSRGSDKATPNCFAFPMDGGGWRVYRFSMGIAEDASWSQDKNGWTTCYFNRLPDFDTVCRTYGGAKNPDNGEYYFKAAVDAVKAAEALGQKVDIPEQAQNRDAFLKMVKGKLALSIKKEKSDESWDQGWVPKRSQWVREITPKVETTPDRDDEMRDFDDLVRSLNTPARESAGWVVKAQDGTWIHQPQSVVKMVLQANGLDKTNAEIVMGQASWRAWTMVSLPFQAEYPGGRQWNLDAPQLLYQPAELADDEVPHHPHWDLILAHFGTELNTPIQNAPWSKRMHIHNGKDYLTAWIASMIREPFEPLPYLFAFGSQNGGKSIFHEAIEQIVTKGVVRADRALGGHNDFNGELAGAVLCVVEEKNIAASKVSYERMKDWITSPTLSIRKMRTDSYQVPNTTHWVQTTNKQEYCPVFPGDTRITVVAVPDLLPEQIIPKKILLQRLRDEAPHFLRTLMDWPLPEPEDRLRLPVVVTSSKIRSEELQRSELEQFIDECVFKVPGECISFKEFYAKFVQWLSEEGLDAWKRKRVASELPASMPIFDHGCNVRYIGNVSFVNVKATKPPIVATNRKQIGGEP